MSSFLYPYITSGFPCVAVETHDPMCVIGELLQHVKQTRVALQNATPGLMDCKTGIVLDQHSNYKEAFQMASNSRTILFLQDFQYVMQQPNAYRTLLNNFSTFKKIGSMVIILAPPPIKLPAELQHEIPVLSHQLPSRETISEMLDVFLKQQGVNGIKKEKTNRYADSLSGLTLPEAENYFSLEASKTKFSPDIADLETHKMGVVKQTGLIEIFRPVPPENMGGLSNLKSYYEMEVKPFVEDKDLRVKAILLVGIPGTGKSLACKVLSGVLGWPLLKVDFGLLKGSLVGQSEANTKKVLNMTEAVAPAVLWFDEIEKGIGGYKSSASSDGGTTLGMVGILLSWLQELNKPITIVATCNDYKKLPPEFTRAGRFDERFFVGLPNTLERREIMKIHYKRLMRKELASNYDSVTEGLTGAEIEQLIKTAARLSNRDSNVFEYVIKSVRPTIKEIAKTEDMKDLYEWAKSNLRMAHGEDLKSEKRSIINDTDL